MPTAATPCPRDDLFRRLLDRQLPAPELAALQAHLDRCPDCMELFLALLQDGPGASGAAVAQTGAAADPADAVPAQVEEYRLLRPLGRGAMGQVFLAHDTLLDRPVALKLLSAEEPSDAARDRFLVEARAIARLSHPNVVRIYRVGALGRRPFLVSELVSGRSLDKIERPLPAAQVIHIGLGLCRGLSAAHRRGVLHRDVKPANAILADDGEVKLLDFGLAKLTDAPWPPEAGADAADAGADASPSLTRTGTVLGTPSYMAPELWGRGAATEQSDLYALGALLYELCAGRPPHEARTLRELLRAVQRKRVRPLHEVARGVPRALSQILDRCLQKRPQDRFPSAEALGEALARLRGPDPVPPGAPARARRRSLRAVQAGHRALRLVRSAEIAAVLALLQREPRVILAGDAGVGKTGFCRDGVLPAVAAGALRDGRAWSVRALRPGPQPLAALAAVLAPWLGVEAGGLLARLRSEPGAVLRQLGAQQPPGTGLLLFVDQVEELLTRSGADEAAALGELLAGLPVACPDVRTLLSVRGAELARLAVLPGLGDEPIRALFLLRPISAAGALATARRRAPGDPHLLRRLGAACRQLGQNDVAAAVLERAVEQAPADVRARRLLSRTHAACGHVRAAIEQARAAVRLQADGARGWRLLGRLCLDARDWDAAREALRQAVALQPDHRLAQRWLGEALLASGQAAEAAGCFEAAAALGLSRLSRLAPEP